MKTNRTMEQESIVTTSLLEIQNLQYAHEQYNDFVDISGPLLNISEFKTRRGLPLNEQCAAVFYGKIAHLKDTDFVELDRQMLQLIGFKNTFSKKKDKHGNVKKNEHGNPMLADKRHDFHNAIRCLRKTAGFIEGKSFDDSQCHFIVHKAGGDNKHTVWIRKRMLDHFIVMANTSNSRMIREFFIDLKHMMTEYTMYQTVYRSKQAMRIKDSRIDELLKKIDRNTEKIDAQNKKIDAQCNKIDAQCEKLNRMARILK